MIKMDENNIIMMGSRQTWLLPLSAQSEAKWRRLPDLVRARHNFHLAQLGSRSVSTSCVYLGSLFHLGSRWQTLQITGGRVWSWCGGGVEGGKVGQGSFSIFNPFLKMCLGRGTELALGHKGDPSQRIHCQDGGFQGRWQR